MAAYFTLAFQPDLPQIGDGTTAGDTCGGGQP